MTGGALVLACGVPAARPDWRALPANPGRAELDPLLASAHGRVVVVGADADLAAVVQRLVRAERLAELTVGFVPVRPEDSTVARLWNLPADALDLALSADPVPIPVVRDDSGGVLVGLGRIGPVAGEAYCDDQLALRGRAKAIEVTPDPLGVCARVISGRFGRKPRTYRGRAVQIGCRPATTVTANGVEHPRPVPRWTWYRHTEELRAVLTPVS